MTLLALVLLAGAGALSVYAVVGYPALLLAAVRRRRPDPLPDIPPGGWPTVSLTVPAHNEASQIRETLESLLRIDYPADRLQIVVVSDGSTDGTDAMVATYADRGVELLRVEPRRGKSAAENLARHRLRGEIVVNTDASVRIDRHAVKRLVRRFADPTVGLASGRDVSVERAPDETNRGEGGYVGYEMWVRDLETRAGGIVGASGCLYAIRRPLHDVEVPEHLSRDFMSALTARERGYRAVSVPDALCVVPRTPSLRREYRRKVRTVVRGMQTLLYKRHLLDPRRYGAFSWRLWSHKACRWAIPWAAGAALGGLALLAPAVPWALAVLLAGAGFCGLAAAGWWWPEGRPAPAVVSVPAYLVSGGVAVCVATVRAIRGYDASIWEPTRREGEAERAVAAG